MLIFLDIDGVLNRLGEEAYDKYGWSHNADHTNWHKDLLVNLERVCVTTGADVVISSSWRMLYKDVHWWNEQFKLAGVKVNVIDITGRSNNGFRGREIYSWLSDHSYSKYVIIDDESDFFPDQPRIKCAHEDGLTEAKAQEAIDVLTGHKRGFDLWCMEERNPPEGG